MPKLVSLYIRQVAIGFVISAFFTVCLIYFDVAGLKHLVMETRDGVLGALLIFYFNGLIFGAVQFAWVIMAMREKDGGEGGGGTPLRLFRHRHARVHVEAEAERGEKRRARTRPFG